MAENTRVADRGRENEIAENIACPAADIFETPDAFVLMLDMPGASKESIKLTLERNELAVRARVERPRSENTSVLFTEIRTTGYEREFNLGEGIDRSNVDARFEHGVLTVKLFKGEQLKAKEIAIQ